MRRVWLRWLVASVMMFNFGVLGLGSVALAQQEIATEGLNFDTPAAGAGNTICNVAKAIRNFIGGAIVAAIIIWGLIRFSMGDSRGAFGLIGTGVVGAIALATMPDWIGGLINGCTL